MVCVRQLSNASPFTTTRHTELLFSEVMSHVSGRDYRQRRKEAPLETLPQGTEKTSRILSQFKGRGVNLERDTGFLSNVCMRN